MKGFRSFAAVFIVFALPRVLFASTPQAELRPTGQNMELAWPASWTDTQQSLWFPEFEVQASTNLLDWQAIGGKLRGIPGRSSPEFRLSLDKLPGQVFYRVLANSNTNNFDETGLGGAQVFGFDQQFAANLSAIGYLPVEDFATNAGNLAYLSQLSWDPTTAQFWPNFYATNLFQATYGAGLIRTQISYNFRLDADELAIFRTNGFVVSERLGSPTFGDLYYRIFNCDLPVFVTSDSILHAWHRSYQTMLEELEELVLSTLLESMLNNMSARLPSVRQQFGQGPLAQSILDADYFLTVARSLWATQQVASALNEFSVDQQVSQTLAAVNALSLRSVPLFNGTRKIDFSQFKVRGHYDASERLRRYFRTMMWCGRTDLRLMTYEPNKEDDVNQLGVGVVLYHLLTASGQLTNWTAFEQITRTFVGLTDSMTFPQFGGLLADAGIHSPADITSRDVLVNLQTRLLTGELGLQSIHSDFFYSPLSAEQIKLPRSLTLLGQKFVLDSWAFSQTVFDRILWPSDDCLGGCGKTNVCGKVIRRKPSCLDVAYSVFGNDQTVPELVARMTTQSGELFRDGLPYQHNLLAVREVIDGVNDSAWSDNIYTAWLAALRSLSRPTTGTSYPEAMRTRAWAMKTLNTQLASWTQLRHDTLLYAKQSYTEPALCSYPAGFVEPRPEFFHRVRALSDITAAVLSQLPLSGSVSLPIDSFPGSHSSYELASIKAKQLAFLSNFSLQAQNLEDMASRELAQQPFSAAQTGLLKDVVERSIDYLGVRQWNGWYPQLFYSNNVLRGGWSLGSIDFPSPGCDIWDPMVADVHTDLPDDVVCDPGAVLHEAVGQVDLLMVAIDNGPDRTVYAGPVLSHYEFELPADIRLTDPEWKTQIQAGQKPSRPHWTQQYLVPGSFPIPPGYP